MRKEYDFDKMKGRKNPYAKSLKKQVSIRMGVDVIPNLDKPEPKRLSDSLAKTTRKSEIRI